MERPPNLFISSHQESKPVPDKERLTTSRLLQILVPIVSATVALVSLSLTIAARKKELTCAYLGGEKIISFEPSRMPADLKVELHGQGIASLEKMRFALRNTGSAAIRAEDVKESLRLVYPSTTKILNSVVDRTSPADFIFHASVAPEQSAVICDFVLLNAGDEADFSIYLYNSEATRPEFRGRVVDVRTLESVDESAYRLANPFPFIKTPNVRKVLYRGILTGSAVLAALFILVAVFSGIQFVKGRLWEQKWGERYRSLLREFSQSSELDYSLLESRLGPQAIRFSQRIYGKPGGRKPPDDYVRFTGILAQSSIPFAPESTFDTWKEFLGVTLLFLACIVFFGFTTVFIYNSPGGF
jgi:hypothetical protein